jgi:hypothetical protein
MKLMRKRPRQTKLEKLGDVLHQILKERNILLSSEKQHLQKVWSSAVGSQIAAQTCPDKLRKGSLFVKVSTSVWMQQLHFMKGEIIDKVNRQAGKVLIENILFSIGDVKRNPRMDHDQVIYSPKSDSLKERDRKLIEQSTSLVPDPELRDILKRVMTKDIIRRRLGGTRKGP